jgi:hypothetical protein
MSSQRRECCDKSGRVCCVGTGLDFSDMRCVSRLQGSSPVVRPGPWSPSASSSALQGLRSRTASGVVDRQSPVIRARRDHSRLAFTEARS